MTLMDLWVSTTSLFTPVLGAILVLCAVVLTIARLFCGKTLKGKASFVVSLGFLGRITGLIAGVSQESIVEALVTSMLGIISALLMYLLSSESLKDWRPVIPFALILLLVSTLAGLSIGGSYKANRSEHQQAYDRRLMLYEKVDLEVCKEERLKLLKGETFPTDYQAVSCPES